MNCQEVREIIPQYLEQDLDSIQMNQMRNHIENCRACQQEVTIFEKTWDVLETWEDIEPAPGFVPFVMPAPEIEKNAQINDNRNSSPVISKKDSSFLDKITSLFSFKVPAWAAAVACLAMLFAGHNLLPHRETIVRNTNPYYTAESENANTENLTLSYSDEYLWIPRTTELITTGEQMETGGNDSETAETHSDNDWNDQNPLELIDIESLFEI